MAQSRSEESGFPIDILGSQLSPTNAVRNLGVYFDSGFTFSNHVSAVCKASFVWARNGRPYLGVGKGWKSKMSY